MFLLKRAQIFAADVWGAFGESGPGAFTDLHALTTFADYRVPVVLRQMGMLVYSAELAAQVGFCGIKLHMASVEDLRPSTPQHSRGCRSETKHAVSTQR